MSSINEMAAVESMFDPEQTTAKLLEAVKENVAKNVKTVEAAAQLETKLSEEAAEFNSHLTAMANAIRKCEQGELSREEMLAECKPCVAALKEKCSALKLADVKTTGDDITENEIAMLREYIVGCKDIVADHMKALQDAGAAEAPKAEEKPASEGLLAGLATFEPATEASLASQIRKSNEAKTATALYNQAKKLYGLGSKEKALETLKKAQGLYEKCLEKTKEHGKMYKVERKVHVSGVSDKFEREVTDSYGVALTLKYFEDRIDACKALEMQWSNKAGKSSYAETKAQLKEERKQAKAEMREKRRAEKEAAKQEKAEESVMDEVLIDGMTTNDFINAMESYADFIEADLALEAALEAEGAGEEASPKSASSLAARFRAAFAKMKKAKAADDQAAVAAAEKEVAEVSQDLQEATDAAETPEEKKKLSKAAKVGIASAVAVAAAAAVTAVVLTKGKKVAEGESIDPKSGAKLIEQLSSAIKRAPGAIKHEAEVAGATVAYAAKRGAKKVAGAVKDEAAHASGTMSQAKAAVSDAGKRVLDHAKGQQLVAQMKRNLKNADKKELASRLETIKNAGGDAEWTKMAIAEVKKAFKLANESVLSAMAFGLEGLMCDGEECEQEKIEPMEGKAFDDELDAFEDEEMTELEEMAAEAAVAVMLAEDGIED